MTVREALAWAVPVLTQSGADSPRLTAEILAGEAFGLSRLELITRNTEAQPENSVLRFRALVARRTAGEPVAYILGTREFYGLDFLLGPQTLIPRPETELIIELTCAAFLTDVPLRYADFGTGSGILAVTLAHLFRRSQGLAVDLSPGALAVARRNAQAHGVANRVDFLLADMTQPLLRARSFNLIVSNPPYVTEPEYAALEREVRDHEPRLALVSPGDGLWHVRGLVRHAASALKPGGLLLVEIGSGQGEAALAAVVEHAPHLVDARIVKDAAGLDRVLRASAPVV